MRDKIDVPTQPWPALTEPGVCDEILVLLTRCQAGDIITAGPAMIQCKCNSKIRYHQEVGGGGESVSCLSHISSEDN